MSAREASLAPPSGPPREAAWLAWLAASRAWLFLAVLVAGFEIWSQLAFGASFIGNPYNIRSIAIFATAPLLLAVGQTFVIISGGIDLSVGFTMGLAAVVASQAMNATSDSLGPWGGLLVGVAAAAAAALVPGVVNGLLIARLRVPPFIGTLGMYGVARGVAYLVAGGTTVPVANPVLGEIGNGAVGPVPIVVLVTAAAMLGLHYLLSQTRFGQYVYAIGGNRQAAVRAGIAVGRVTVWLYVLAALCAGLGGVLYAGRFSAGAAQAGEPLLLDSIAAVVIGGASLFGGSGTLVGTLIGALIVAVIQYGLVFINVEPFWQFVAVGVVIIISVLVDQSQRNGAAGSMSEALLEARAVSKRFGGVHALENVSFRVEAGEVVALAGDNGAGKSTLIKIVSGVFQPSEGDILLPGPARGVRQPAPRAGARHRDDLPGPRFGRQPGCRRQRVPRPRADAQAVRLPAGGRSPAGCASRRRRRWRRWTSGWTGWTARCGHCPAASGSAWRSGARSTGAPGC